MLLEKRDPLETKYKKLLGNFHDNSERHVLVLEADMPYHDKCRIFHYADLVRKAGNELTGLMLKKYLQLIRTKRYRKLKALHRKNKGNQEVSRNLSLQMKEMEESYNLSWDCCRRSMIPIAKKYGIGAVFGLTQAEDVWQGVQECLRGKGETVHFKRRGILPEIRAKQIKRGITVKAAAKTLLFGFAEMKFSAPPKDRFQEEETGAIIAYLNNPEECDRKAVQAWTQEGIKTDTFRPCYASLVCKKIRGKCRVFVHITVEGRPMPKYDRKGNLRHKYGRGRIGCDIGTQTIAYTAETEVGLKNLAERGRSISHNERLERVVYRAMDRSRRMSNPENYNEDGTIRKGPKKWRYSKHYIRLREKHRELCRINAENRHLAINEEVNRLRSLGDVFITEPKNFKQLQRRAKKTTVNQKGKTNKKKRFGKSLKNRCPGYFQAQAERKFRATGMYIEVPKDYRASQYDHTGDKYVKKKLSQRLFRLEDNTLVQRDWYSSFLLYNADLETRTIDKGRCRDNFNTHYEREKAMIEGIRENGIKILNSGIKAR